MKVLLLLVVSMTFILTVFQFPLRKRTDDLNKHEHEVPFRGTEVGETLKRACGDCHSNQTNWPWYSHVAPVSWWIHNHVRQAQRELNFSGWEMYPAAQRRDELESICGIISIGRMPPRSYRLVHPQATLSAQEKEAICAWANSEAERNK